MPDPAVCQSVREMVERYGGKVSARTPRRWRRRDQGRSWIRAGKQIFYNLASVEQWEA